MTRRGAGVAVAVLVAGCAAREAPVTASSLPDGPRHPDGVVVEPAPATPPPEPRADVRAAVVALREPLGGQAVVAVARALFRAYAREDMDAMIALLAEPDHATFFGPDRGLRAPLLEAWRTRFHERDYRRLAGTDVARYDAIERWSYADLGGPGAPERPPEMRDGDLLARVPMAVTHVGSEQLFGDVVDLVLRRVGDDYKIVAYGEEGGDAP